MEEVIDLFPDDVEGYVGPSFADARVCDVGVPIQEAEDDIEEFRDEENAMGAGRRSDWPHSGIGESCG